MLRLGIVGLPNVGKSTLFNALTSARALVANYPFATIEPNTGVVQVPDPRLDVLASLVRPERVVPATVEFVDIAGLVKGASEGEGLGNQFLANIREVDAIVHVVRCFDDPDGQHARVVLPTADEAAAYRSFNLLTAKPVLYAANVGETEVTGGNHYVEALARALATDHETAELVTFSAKVEAELAELAPADRC